ncbi:MAG: hypothetical protein ABSB28_08655 [Candidatus Bathyarchaeia archaeon]
MKIRWQTHRKWLSQTKVFEAFKNEKGAVEAKTWSELEAKVPRATLSRTLRDLMKEGNVQASLRLGKNGKLETVYKLVHEWQTVKHHVVQASYKGKPFGTYEGMIYMRRGKLHCRLPEDEKKRLLDDQKRAQGARSTSEI